MAVQKFVGRERDYVVEREEECTGEKIFAVVLTEAILLINIPISIIEVLVRAILTLLILPLRCFCSEATLAQFDYLVTRAGIVLSATHAINNVILLIRNLDSSQKLDIGSQMPYYLRYLNVWAAQPDEFDRPNPRI